MISQRVELQRGIVEGEFYTPLDNGRLRCEICPRLCTLSDGQRAFCFVREARDGAVVLNAYGRSSGFCIDPIEKKPLNHFLPGTAVLSFGTAGCNLGCKFCQNWDISKARQIDRLSESAYPEAIAKAALAHGCAAVAMTYNDPVIFHEYAIDTAQACRDRDIRSVAVTAGYITPKARKTFFRYIDAVNVDLKAFSETFYRKLCAGSLQPVLDTLRYLKHETDLWLEVTTLLIPKENDSSDEIKRMCEWFLENMGPKVPLHFSAFHPDFKMLHHTATPADTLKRARRIAIKAGVHYVYTGNIYDPDGQSTRCPTCAQVVIGRDRYALNTWKLESGLCSQCATPIAGRFNESPGVWGNQRRPLHII
jgi:pyruvate formate lyase activating enzyme